MTVLGIERDLARTAARLARVARELAADGETGDTVLRRAGRPLDADLHGDLETLLRRPDAAAGYWVVEGLFGGIGEPGPTPLHWRDADQRASAAYDIALALVASVVGDVFGWVNQQDGRIVHNIVPSPGCEELQIGASSSGGLAAHTEDAFHPDRADFLLLACVRNPDGIGSSLATITDVELPASDIAELGRPVLVVLPDDSYPADTTEDLSPVGMSTLWRRANALCLRYDPAYTRLLTDDADFRRAYERLGHELERRTVTAPLSPGDLLIIDNDLSVHGRTPFRARYDGTDRWLKRILVRSGRPRPASERQEHGFGQVQVTPRADAGRPCS